MFRVASLLITHSKELIKRLRFTLLNVLFCCVGELATRNPQLEYSRVSKSFYQIRVILFLFGNPIYESTLKSQD